MPEGRQEEALATIGIFTVLAYIFIGMRLYSRYLGRNFGWDDYLIIFAAVCFFGEVVTIWKWILLSCTGFHMWDIPKKSIHQQVINNQWNLAVQMLYHPLMGSIRASIILFLFRMNDNRRRVRYSLHVVFYLNILYAISTSLGNILQCRPISYTWSKPEMDQMVANGKIVPGGTCINSRTFILASCALSIFMDLIIIPIPSIMVWNLQMERRTKMLVVTVMSLGWIATGVSVGRLIVYYYRFAPTNTDRTYNIGLAISIAEPSVHIISACAPATKCLFRYSSPHFARSRTSATYQAGQTGQTRKISWFASRGSFRFGFSTASRNDTVRAGEDAHGVPEDMVMTECGPKNGHGHVRGRGDSAYGTSEWYASESQDTIKPVESVDEDKECKRDESVPLHEMLGNGSTKTAATSVDDFEAQEPKHCLGGAK